MFGFQENFIQNMLPGMCMTLTKDGWVFSVERIVYYIQPNIREIN
jgi:hypothetical protein